MTRIRLRTALACARDFIAFGAVTFGLFAFVTLLLEAFR